MAYCGPRGIPLSTFLSWDQHDQDAALAWAGHESRRCQSCGSHPDEGARHAHVDVCPGCVTADRVAGDAKEIRGAHVKLAAGSAGACPRCLEEVALNSRG